MRATIYILTFFTFSLFTGCGFKLVDNTQLLNYYIKDVETKGNSRVNFFLKNELSNKFNNSGKGNEIKIEIVSKKEKKIKEKNISNQITKYEITLKADIRININSKNVDEKFNVSANGSFDVNKIQATTISNQDNLEIFLTEKLSKQILDRIKLIINDL
tara:strand:+ start:115 stop:591 length:477 start_codon:yes stop_codon:yes gene_type:complete